MRLEHDVAWLWEEQSYSSNMCLEGKEVLLMLYYINENWHYFIKEYLKWCSKFAFQEVARPVGQPNRHILEILLDRRHFLVVQNHRTSVRLHHWLLVHYHLIIKMSSMINLNIWDYNVETNWKNVAYLCSQSVDIINHLL